MQYHVYSSPLPPKIKLFLLSYVIILSLSDGRIKIFLSNRMVWEVLWNFFFDVKIWRLAVKPSTCFAQKHTFHININPLNFLIVYYKLCRFLINSYPMYLNWWTVPLMTSWYHYYQNPFRNFLILIFYLICEYQDNEGKLE
jgi:hypothetical protein